MTFNQIKAYFIGNGSSLTAWCKKHKIHRWYVIQVFNGQRKGKSALALKQRLIDIASDRRND